jgi:hypothetical protein
MNENLATHPCKIDAKEEKCVTNVHRFSALPSTLGLWETSVHTAIARLEVTPYCTVCETIFSKFFVLVKFVYQHQKTRFKSALNSFFIRC